MSNYTVEKCTQNNKNKSVDEISPAECMHLIDYVPTIDIKLYDESNNEITENFGEKELNIKPSMNFNKGLPHTEMASIQAKDRINNKYVFSIVRTGAEGYNEENPLSIKKHLSGWENHRSITPLASSTDNVPITYSLDGVGSLKLNNPLIIDKFTFKVTKNDTRRIGAIKFHVNGEGYDNTSSVTYSKDPQTTRPVKARIDFNISYKDVNVKINFQNPQCLGYLSNKNDWKCVHRTTGAVNDIYFMDRDGNKYSKNETDKKTINTNSDGWRNHFGGEEFNFTIPANTDLNKFKIDIGNDGMALDRIAAESVGSTYWDPSVSWWRRSLIYPGKKHTRNDITKKHVDNMKKWQPNNAANCKPMSDVLGQKPYFEMLKENTFDGTGKSDIKIDNRKFKCVKDRRERAFELEINTTSKENVMMLMSTGKASKYKCFNIRLINGKVAVMGYNYDFTFGSSRYGDLRDGNWHKIAIVYTKHLPSPYDHWWSQYNNNKNRYCVILYIDGHLKDIKWDKKSFDTEGDNNYLGVSNHKGSESRYIGKMKNVKFYKVAKDFNYQCKAWFRYPWWIKNKTQEVGWGNWWWERKMKRLVERDVPQRAIVRFVDDSNTTLASSYIDIIENPDGNTSHRCEVMITDFPASVNVKGIVIEYHNLLNISNITANIIPTSSGFTSVNNISCTKTGEETDSAYSEHWKKITCDLSSKINITPIILDDPTEAIITIVPKVPINMYQYGMVNANYLSTLYSNSQKDPSMKDDIGLTENIDDFYQDNNEQKMPAPESNENNVDGFSNYFEAFNSKVEGFTGFTTGGDAKQSDIKKLHNDVVKQRSTMDQQLAELNKEKNSVYQEQKKRYDRTMFGGIVMSILATSLAYYTFTEI